MLSIIQRWPMARHNSSHMLRALASADVLIIKISNRPLSTRRLVCSLKRGQLRSGPFRRAENARVENAGVDKVITDK